MKKKAILIFTVFFMMAAAVSAGAQSLKSQSLNGSTGLYSIPTGFVGWDKGGHFALDLGYRAIINNDEGVTHIPAVTATFFKWVEISSAYDFQPYKEKKRGNDDLLLGLKVKIPSAKDTGIAVGVNVQMIDLIDSHNDYRAYQPYLAITYPGSFFKMPAESTIVIGKTFYEKNNNSNIDIGIGFDLILFPDVLGNVLHGIIDFANFGYSEESWPEGSAWYRGNFNAGFRIDLSAIPALEKIKLVIDVAFNDLFDAGTRSFTAGAVFGFSAKGKS